MTKLRAVPFGYTIRSGEIVISPKDAEIVMQIFRKYLDGNSMDTIGEIMGYSRDSIRKILCTDDYIGTDRCPQLISEEIYEAVSRMRIKKQRGCYQIPEEQKRLRKMMFCKECRKNLYHGGRKGNLNSWGCYAPECRKVSCKLPIEELMHKIMNILNAVGANLNLLNTESETVIYSPDSEIIRQQNEIRHMMGNSQTDYERIKTELFCLAEMKCNCCTYIDIPQKTKYLKSLLANHEQLNTFDIGLLKSCVKRITASHSAVIEIEFINGVKISERKESTI